MASTSSDSLQEELCRLHRCLVTEIASNLDSESGEGQNFLFHIKCKLGAGIFSRHKSLADKIKALETKNVFGLEKYEGLKNICEDSGNLNLIEIIEKCEDNMKGIRSKYQQNESSESTKEECERIKRKLSKNEILVLEQKEEIKKLRVEDSDEQKQMSYEKAKSELRNKIIQEYQNTVLKVPAIPLLPDETCEFSQIYVRPNIVTEVKDKKGKTKETEIKSLTEIFTKNGVLLKSVYVVGDAGTGKSSFCNYLVNCWCRAHSEGQAEEDTFDGVNEMKKFDFLFFISLRHNLNIDSIHEMLKNQYDIDILGTLLENESAKMIILLDGLDEWSSEGKIYNQFQTMGLPKRDVFKEYTILTTSRPWKFHASGIRDTEVQQKLKLKGFDDKSEREMVKRTVSYINFQKGESKDINDCLKKLGEKSLKKLKEVPIMLQQLICLWFDGKLDKTSRWSDVYTGMLELFFTWNDDKTVGAGSEIVNVTQNIELPECFADNDICEINSHLIFELSRLAYETLFNCPNKSMVFDISLFRKLLKMTDEVRQKFLKLGLLTVGRCPSLSLSKHPKSVFSFTHKSMQEFLAAVNIDMKFKTKMSSPNNLENIDLQRECIQFVKEVFKNCSRIDEILGLSDVIIMLCRLEPRLAYYICDFVKGDPVVQRYRRTVYDDKYIRVIQSLIFDLKKECETSLVKKLPEIYIEDLYINSRYDPHIMYFERNSRKFVRSVNISKLNTINGEYLQYLPQLLHLEKLQIRYDTLRSSSYYYAHPIDEVNTSVAETIKKNASTLKSLTICDRHLAIEHTDKLNSLCKEVVCILPGMNNLVAIKMTDMTMSHDDTTRFCEYLKGTSLLEQIHLDITCECRKQHDVNFSKHHKLQYFHCTCICVTDVTYIDTVNLVNINCTCLETNRVNIINCLMKCDKLRDLTLFTNYKNKSQSFHTNISKGLVSVLKKLHHLSNLTLWYFRLTDNIIQAPSEMKSLKDIDLYNVTMSLKTWKKFVDSLPSIPHPLDVKLCSYNITGDDEEFNDDLSEDDMFKDDMLPFGGKEKDAIQYVKDREQLFHVRQEFSSFEFEFSTK